MSEMSGSGYPRQNSTTETHALHVTASQDLFTPKVEGDSFDRGHEIDAEYVPICCNCWNPIQRNDDDTGWVHT